MGTMGIAAMSPIGVRSLHCSGCAGNAGKALLRLDGAIRANADSATGRVEVRCDPERVTEAGLRDRIRAAGFEPL